jgi:Tfp pilus assembly protein PilO
MREKIVRPLTFILILFLGFILYGSVISPRRQGFRSLSNSLKQMEFKINSLLGEEVALRGGGMEKEALEKELQQLVARIPSERDIPRIINQLVSQVSKGLKIDYTLIEPGESKNEGKYKRVPLELKFFSSYKDFTRYLAQLKDLSAATRIESLDLKTLPGEKDKLEIHLLLSAFVMPVEDESFVEKVTRVSPEAVVLSPGVSPFAPKETPPTTIKEGEEKELTFTLQGIVGENARLGALINDALVYPGDIIQGYRVVSIKKSEVILQQGENILRLPLP